MKRILLLACLLWGTGKEVLAQQESPLPIEYRILIAKACEMRSRSFPLEEIEAYAAQQLTLRITRPGDEDYGLFYALNEPNALILATVGSAYWEQYQHCQIK